MRRNRMDARDPAPEQLLELVAALAATAASEIDCDQLAERIAPFVESLEDGRTRLCSDEARAVEQHLAVCVECREEVDALRAALRDLP